eukprot:1481272-Prymnesium_polylepis.1
MEAQRDAERAFFTPCRVTAYEQHGVVVGTPSGALRTCATGCVCVVCVYVTGRRVTGRRDERRHADGARVCVRVCGGRCWAVLTCGYACAQSGGH